jgi:transposase
MKITTIGLDIAKRFFHIVCCNEQGRLIKKRMLKRTQVLAYFQNQPKCLVALEACATSHYWAREIQKCGHKVKLIPPQHVKAFLIGNKNDYNDALAIAVAAKQPHIKNVGIKTIEQQDNQAQHKAKELAVRQRTALCNQIRGLIAEYGIILSQGVNNVRKNIPLMLDDETAQLSNAFKLILAQLREQLKSLDNCIDMFGKTITESAKSNPVCQRLQTIPGVGSMIGLNAEILNQYIEYISNQRLTAIGFDAPFKVKSNPLPWMNAYLVSDNVQVAPQETEISSYLVGQVDSTVDADDFDDFDL